MPCYQYQCNKCGQVFTDFRTIEQRDMKRPCGFCNSINIQRLILPPNITKDSTYRDSAGERIWFPKDNRPYFDHALRRTFNTPKEKQKYLKDKNLIMDGSSNPKKWPIESASMRDKSYRKTQRMED